MSQSAEERAQFEEHRRRTRERLRRPGRPRERMNTPEGTVELIGTNPATDSRVDKEWEDDEARRRRDNWDGTRDDRLMERQAARESLTAGERLDHALRQLSLRMGGMRSRSIESMRSAGKPDSGAPPAPADSTEELESRLTLIAHHIEAIERDVDSADGLRLERGSEQGFYGTPGNSGGFSDFRMRGTAERDRIVFDQFQGVRSADVAAEAPYLGTSARTIERARVCEAARRGLKVRPVDGVVVGEEATKAA